MSKINPHHVTHTKRLLMIGFGSIGEGVLPLLLRHINIKPEQITIITADDRGADEAKSYGIERINHALTRDNFRAMLEPRLSDGDILVNVSVDVSSTDLVEFCQTRGALYIDTCIEPWPGGYTDPTLSASARSNYALREKALALRTKYPNGPSALLTHGANPGLVSHFVKQALLNMAKDLGMDVTPPTTKQSWGALMESLGIKVVHIAERDTQVSNQAKQVGEFVNTWSIDGFYSEGCQPAELGWGTHEKHFPKDGARHRFGSRAAVYLKRPGCTTRVRSWTPLEGPYQGYLITHNEAISIPDYFATHNADGTLRHRVTCHYAYHPCDDAILSLHELNGKLGQLQTSRRLMMEEITSGTDELGVLLMGNDKGVYWYGSRLTIDEARKLVPYNNATSLQVTAAVMAGVIWLIENPQRGVVEPEDIDYRRIIDLAAPYLGQLVGVWGDWNPLQNRGVLFAEDIDSTDPWQFKNIRVG
jgi:homospermidine synthase